MGLMVSELFENNLVGADITRPAEAGVEFAQDQCESMPTTARAANSRPYKI